MALNFHQLQIAGDRPSVAGETAPAPEFDETYINLVASVRTDGVMTAMTSEVRDSNGGLLERSEYNGRKRVWIWTASSCKWQPVRRPTSPTLENLINDSVGPLEDPEAHGYSWQQPPGEWVRKEDDFTYRLRDPGNPSHRLELENGEGLTLSIIDRVRFDEDSEQSLDFVRPEPPDDCIVDDSSSPLQVG